jgi:hypothetical protein
MLGDNFRPSGDLSWILKKLPIDKWDVIGCLSFEDRCLGTLADLQAQSKVANALYYKIIDPPSKDSTEIERKLEVNMTKFLGLGRSNNEVKEYGLLEPVGKVIDDVINMVTRSAGNIILDISTFPKRFFFPILKILLQQELTNLLIAYTNPKSYCKEDLSGNPDTWSNLPLFGNVAHPEPTLDLAIVGVGFMPFGLPRLLEGKYSAIPVKFLFPFPPGPPNYQRTWEFMRKIELSFNLKETDKIIKLDSNNLSDAYDYINYECANGEKNVIFAPYGPKPISLAMCLYASKHNSPVFYTQPHHYNPHYSSGIKNTYCYCIKLNSKLLY